MALISWNKLVYGWDLDDIGTELLLVPDFNHWLINKDTQVFDEEMFAQHIEEKNIKAVYFKVSDANNTTGQQFYDWTADKWYALSRKYNLAAGGYHWLQPSVDPKNAWDFYHDWLKDHPCELPPILDFEETKIPSAADIIWRAKEWFGYANAYAGERALMYTGLGYIDTLRGKLGNEGKTSVQIKDILLPFGQQPLILAYYSRYEPKEGVRRNMKYRIVDGKELWPWEDYVAWQYSPNADDPYYLDGDNKNAQEWGFESKGLDMNYFRASYLSRFIDQTPQIPPDVPQPADPTLTEAIDGWTAELNSITSKMQAYRDSVERGEP